MASWNKIPIGEICYKCGKKAERREHNKKKNWTGKYLCISCYIKHYHNSDYKYRPEEILRRKIICSISDRRTCNLNPNSTQAFGDNCEELTSRWIGVKMLSKELDHYGLSYDHSRDKKLGIIQTKGARLSTKRQGLLEYKVWMVDTTNLHNSTRKGFDFDNLILYCISKDEKIIERIYIFPEFETLNRTSMCIYKDDNNHWYDKYMITNEVILKNVNEIWRVL